VVEAVRDWSKVRGGEAGVETLLSPGLQITGAICPSIFRAAQACVDRCRARFSVLHLARTLSAYEPGVFLLRQIPAAAKGGARGFFSSSCEFIYRPFQAYGSPSRHTLWDETRGAMSGWGTVWRCWRVQTKKAKMQHQLHSLESFLSRPLSDLFRSFPVDLKQNTNQTFSNFAFVAYFAYYGVEKGVSTTQTTRGYRYLHKQRLLACSFWGMSELLRG